LPVLVSGLYSACISTLLAVPQLIVAEARFQAWDKKCASLCQWQQWLKDQGNPRFVANTG
jgi:hypothetical protein